MSNYQRQKINLIYKKNDIDISLKMSNEFFFKMLTGCRNVFGLESGNCFTRFSDKIIFRLKAVKIPMLQNVL